MFKPKIIEGGQSAPLPESKKFKKVIIENSVIKEQKIFEKTEIMGLIENIAKEEGFTADQLAITEEFYDKDNNLIGLIAVVKSSRAKGEGWGSIYYDYMIKGSYGKHGGSIETSICRIYGTVDNPDVADQGGIVAKYKNGGWVLTPGVISDRAVDIKIKE